MREAWSRGVTARAAAYWTEARTRELTGGKRLPLLPAEAAPLLRALGLMNGDGSIPPPARRKYQQINHLVALLEPAFLEVAERTPAGRPVRVLDAGCGRSYLSFLLAWCFVTRWRRSAEILGVDREARVIATCRRRVELAALGDVLGFEAAPLEELDLEAAWRRSFGAGVGAPDAVVALHACDTATDEALRLGVALGAGFLAAAPCCHAELARRWGALAEAGAAGPFAPVWASPHLRREVGAAVTDALRVELLRACGYRVIAMEFVGSEHTPKNTLLRAHRRGDPEADVARDAAAALAAYDALRRATGGEGIRLGDALPPARRTGGGS